VFKDIASELGSNLRLTFQWLEIVTLSRVFEIFAEYRRSEVPAPQAARFSFRDFRSRSGTQIN